MPLSVCDYEPCSLLQQALEKIIVIPEGQEAFNFIVVAKTKIVKTYYLPLKYCPFCGTRIEEEWIEEYLKQYRKPKGKLRELQDAYSRSHT